jgi:hypothetical protein
MEIQIFIACIFFTVAYAIAWSCKDYNVIRNDIGYYTDYSRKWHFWGVIQGLLAFTPLTIWLFYWNWELAINLSVVMAFLLWQLHDSILGWRFYRRIFYLGSHGTDAVLEAIFQSAAILSFIRIGFIVTFIYDYFKQIL